MCFRAHPRDFSVVQCDAGHPRGGGPCFPPRLGLTLKKTISDNLTPSNAL